MFSASTTVTSVSSFAKLERACGLSDASAGDVLTISAPSAATSMTNVCATGSGSEIPVDSITR